MAAAIIIRSCFFRLGSAMTDVQNIDSTDDIKLLLDDDFEGLCKVVRRPGGQALVAGVMQDDLGNQVSLWAETKLKLVCHYLCHHDRTLPATVAADITLDNVCHTNNLCATERNHENATAVPLLTASYWPKNIEMLQEFLRGHLGETRIPLAYVIRNEPAIPAVDPPDGFTSV